MNKIGLMTLLMITIFVSIIQSQRISKTDRRIPTVEESHDLEGEEDLNDPPVVSTRRPGATRRRPTQRTSPSPSPSSNLNPSQSSRPRPEPTENNDLNLNDEVEVEDETEVTTRRSATRRKSVRTTPIVPTTSATVAADTDVQNAVIGGTGGKGTAVATFEKNTHGVVSGGNGGQGADIVDKTGGGLNSGSNADLNSLLSFFGTGSQGINFGGKGATPGFIRAGDGGAGDAKGTFEKGASGVVSGGNGGIGGSVISSGGGVVRAGDGGSGSAQATFQ